MAAIDAMIEQYSEGFASGVLLTGSTGHLGSQMLVTLLNDPAISVVYAFNRSGSRSVGERQTAQFLSDGHDINILKSKKLRYVEGDLAEKDLGIPKDLYKEVSTSQQISSVD